MCFGYQKSFFKTTVPVKDNIWESIALKVRVSCVSWPLAAGIQQDAVYHPFAVQSLTTAWYVVWSAHCNKATQSMCGILASLCYITGRCFLAMFIQPLLFCETYL